MADTSNLSQFLGDVADAIRTKKGTTDPIPAANFDTEIESIPTGSVAEKIVVEANQIIEEETVIKIESASIGEPVVIPENGTAEVLADKTLLAEGIGVTAEKIAKGNTILGIEGIAEGGGTVVTEGIKQFPNVEEMNNSTGNEEGDLAVIYDISVKELTETDDSIFVNWQDTVVLDIPQTESINKRSIGYQCKMTLNPTSMKIYTGVLGTSLKAEYSSADGITYTKVSGEDREITKTYLYQEDMTDNMRKFLTSNVNSFYGIYIYSENAWVMAADNLDDITSSDLKRGSVYTKTGIITADGTVWDNLTAQEILSVIHGTENVTSGTYLPNAKVVLKSYKLDNISCSDKLWKNKIYFLKESNQDGSFPLYIGGKSIDAYSVISNDGSISLSLDSQNIMFSDGTTISHMGECVDYNTYYKKWLFEDKLYYYTHCSDGSAEEVYLNCVDLNTKQYTYITIPVPKANLKGNHSMIYDKINNRIYFAPRTHSYVGSDTQTGDGYVTFGYVSINPFANPTIVDQITISSLQNNGGQGGLTITQDWDVVLDMNMSSTDDSQRIIVYDHTTLAKKYDKTFAMDYIKNSPSFAYEPYRDFNSFVLLKNSKLYCDVGSYVTPTASILDLNTATYTSSSDLNILGKINIDGKLLFGYSKDGYKRKYVNEEMQDTVEYWNSNVEACPRVRFTYEDETDPNKLYINTSYVFKDTLCVDLSMAILKTVNVVESNQNDYDYVLLPATTDSDGTTMMNYLTHSRDVYRPISQDEYDVCNNLADIMLTDTPLIDDPNIAVTLDVTNNETVKVENNTLIIEEVTE